MLCGNENGIGIGGRVEGRLVGIGEVEEFLEEVEAIWEVEEILLLRVRRALAS